MFLRSVRFAPALVVAVLCSVTNATAGSVLLGSDYLATVSGTFFNFGGPIGIVQLQGRVIGPGATDTIVERRANAILPLVGSSDTIPIEMVALSLESIAPVNIGGSFFDVFVHLNPSAPSLGTMTINHDFLDNLGPDPEGTFSSSLNVFFSADFTPVGPGAPFTISDTIPLNGSGLWSHEPPPGALLVPGPPGLQQANLHVPLPPLFGDFFIWGSVDEVHPQGAGLHRAGPASNDRTGGAILLPEPSTFALFGLALAGAALLRRRSVR